MFPRTEEEFANLIAQGKTVEYAETQDQNTPPVGVGWEFWSFKTCDGNRVAVWRRIIELV